MIKLTEKNSIHPKYRPDIDGLRAIAVLSVVGFHAFPNFVPGGFIGVDVFFVISGFLISTIIFENIDNHSFSFFDFYSRRIRRIFPALILVLATCLIVGWFTLLADEYAQLGKHVAGGAGFVDNFIFMSEAGYFDNSAITKPLLHLWSLGIEEQFYLLWPLIIIILKKLKFSFFKITLAIFFLSILFSIYILKTNAVIAFYSPLARFWELLLGSLLAWIFLYKNEDAKVISEKYGNLISFFGLALLVLGFAIINERVQFPGARALLPVLGAAMIIFASPSSWLNSSFLARRLLVWLGLISYPLYLWHWPILSFMAIIHGGTPGIAGGLTAIAASIFLAYLTFKCLELRLRSCSGKLNVYLLFLAMMFVGILGLTVFLGEGFENRKIATQNPNANLQTFNQHFFKTSDCSVEVGMDPTFCIIIGNKENIKAAIIGDSSGNSLAPGIGALYAKNGYGLINIGTWSCPPVRGLIETDRWGRSNQCNKIIESAYDYIFKSKTINTVFLAIFAKDLRVWGLPGIKQDASIEEKFNAFSELLKRDVQELNRHGVKVVITFDAPYAPYSAKSCVNRPFNNNRCSIAASELSEREPYQSFFNGYLAGNQEVCIFRQSDFLIKDNIFSFTNSKGEYLVWDTHHLTNLGSKEMAQYLVTTHCAPKEISSSSSYVDK